MDAAVGIDQEREPDPLLLHQPACLVVRPDRDPERRAAASLDLVETLGEPQ